MAKSSNNYTKIKILNTAKNIFYEKGFVGCDIREVAKGAGVSVGSIYNYFESKFDLFMAVLDSMNFEILNTIDELYKETIKRDKDIVYFFNNVIDKIIIANHIRFSIIFREDIFKMDKKQSQIILHDNIKNFHIMISKVTNFTFSFVDSDTDKDFIEKEIALIFFSEMPLVKYFHFKNSGSTIVETTRHPMDGNNYLQDEKTFKEIREFREKHIEIFFGMFKKIDK